MATVNQLLLLMSEKLDCPKYTVEQFSKRVSADFMNMQATRLPDAEIDTFLGDDEDGKQILSLIKQYDLSTLSSFLDDVFNGDIQPNKATIS